jgi:hypothetical protein
MSDATVTASEILETRITSTGSTGVAKRRGRAPWSPTREEIDSLVLKVGRGDDLIADCNISRVMATKYLEPTGLFKRFAKHAISMQRGQPEQKYFLTEAGVAMFDKLTGGTETPVRPPQRISLKDYRALEAAKNVTVPVPEAPSNAEAEKEAVVSVNATEIKEETVTETVAETPKLEKPKRKAATEALKKVAEEAKVAPATSEKPKRKRASPKPAAVSEAS